MTIEQVGPSRTITTKYGQRVVYSLKFKESEQWADLMQKPELPPPTVNQQLEGTIEKNQYGHSFKRTGGFTPVRPQGYSNRQIALQCAARINSDDAEATLRAADKFLTWLDVSNTTPQNTPAETASPVPVENYDALGL